MMRSRTSCLSIGGHLFSAGTLASDAGADSSHHLRDFLQGSHGSVSRSGHSERTVRGAALHRPLRIMSRQKTIYQAGSEGIAAPDAVEDFEILAVSGLVELAIAIADGAPIILRGGFCFAQSGGDNLERIFLHDRGDHLFETFHFERRVMLVHAWDFESERRGKILFIAEHDVYVRSDAAIYFLCGFLSAVGLPEGCAVIQVVGNGCAVAFRRLHGFEGDFGSCRGERAKNSTGVKPASALLAEDFVPIDFARFQLGNGGMAAIVTSEGGTNTEAALGEIETIACGVAYAIVFHPAD